MKIQRRLMTTVPVFLSILMALAVVPPSVHPEWAGHEFEILTLSSRPDTLSGGDVLVQINVPHNISLKKVHVTLNGQDITGDFRPGHEPGSLLGLVEGLKLEENILAVNDHHHGWGRPAAALELVNYPIFGPIFSGPHQIPWICETAASGLGDPLDEHCTVVPRYDWFYRSTAGMFKPLLGLNPPFPVDLAQTTTIDGHTVNYIVRVESGTIDQSIYRIAIIDDPTNPISNPWSAGGQKPGPGWNGKLNFPFGGGCGPGFRSGRNTVTSALSNDALSLGFAVAFGTRNTLQTGCNDVLSAETLMMIKEHFIEHYGVPKYTVGSGGSGGAIQQHMIAQNYPGLLDALTPSSSFPDSANLDVSDCTLFYNYFNNIANPADWPGAKRVKVTGFGLSATGLESCGSWAVSFGTLGDPTKNFDPAVPLELRYDPITNPTGARGTFSDQMVNMLGIDPHTGFARNSWDNVGVQYGLKALNDGGITKEEFLDLNEMVGGFDVDGHFVPERVEADPKAIEIAYITGRTISAENLTLPIIDYRSYTDLVADIHTRERTFSMIERLKKANGTAANQVNWTRPLSGTGIPNLAQLALRAHDEWLTNLAADASPDPYPVKVIRAKPAWLVDTCWDATGVKYEEPATYNGPGVCNTLYPPHANPRLVAGSPLANDVVKCKLNPIDFSSYNVRFTREEKARLKAIFPHGVCDYSRPGMRQQSLGESWLSYPRPGHFHSLDQGDDHPFDRQDHDFKGHDFDD
jgi:hypothetical protein